MDTGRNFANLSREVGASGQNLQHFMSNSPWSAQEVYRQVQQEIGQTPGLRAGGVMLLDESADEKAGMGSAGAGRQYNGRMGKVEMSQVGVFLAYANLQVKPGVWTWIDGELFLPEAWFKKAMASKRQQLGIPKQRHFKTKVELGWDMIERVKANGLEFELVACDCLYGRSTELRGRLRDADLTYMAEVPCDTQVYLQPPVLGIPTPKSRRGRQPSRVQVLSEEPAVRVEALRHVPETDWQRLCVRAIERGELRDRFAARRVWTVAGDHAVEEWLVMRQESDGRYSYALSNAGAEVSLTQLAWWKCQRYFVERANQDAKSELGWDELQAQKYLAWEHHLALTVLASWFIAQTQYEWAQTYPQDPQLLDQLKIDVLPTLSFANVRSLLRAVMPLRQLDTQQAIDQVVEHLFNRTQSRKSRLNKQRAKNAFT
jgi:SRSO17 transposase